MLIPAAPKEIGTSSLCETNPVIPEQSAHFHSRSITMLPTELLFHIASHLSLKDASSLAMVSRRLHLVMCEYGLIRILQYYGNLSKNEQQFYQNLSIANPPLIHHLQTSKMSIIARHSQCTDNLPAICAYHAYHLRNETTNAKSLDFVLNKSFVREEHISNYYINSNHSRLIIKDHGNSQLSIWTAGNNGSWNREFTIELLHYRKCFKKMGKYHGDTIVVPVAPPFADADADADEPVYPKHGAKDDLLAFIQRDESGSWTETQRMTVEALFPNTCGRQDTYYLKYFYYEVSPDGKSLIYSDPDLFVHRLFILGQELDGQWAIKGHFPWSGNKKFSPDSNHIALGESSTIRFLGKQKDGGWITTGILEFEFYATTLTEAGMDEDIVGFSSIAFSPDSRHFVACFDDAQEDGADVPIHVEDFFVVVFSLGDDGQWSEAITMTKHQLRPTQATLLNATFSPNSRYLVIYGKHGLEVCHLTDDNRWVAELKYYKLPPTGYHSSGPEPESTVRFNTCSSLFALFQEGYAMVWQLNDSGVWECQHRFTYPTVIHRLSGPTIDYTTQQLSPDGKTIVFIDNRWRLKMWVQKQHGKWTRQNPAPGLQFCNLVFNQGGYLLAGLPVYDKSCLIVLGITPDGIWQERGRLQTEGNIIHFDFSPCGHSIAVSYRVRNQNILSFWQIEWEPGRQPAMNSTNSRNPAYAS
ncbi:F-box protein [Endozoicomonas sp. SCSIO W0465]|uniref:F-box/WD repeat-containing protein n=1 Tax=Endozoicomonas sp. SCSIO W0465 TaxID=2918516 RepID=UPI002075FF63|nr:F-box protein [Endozoicomonas sp. SCSIO W0465]USE37753.1 F-box protein [Endozoicomonas sp. SCSIO W0465]